MALDAEQFAALVSVARANPGDALVTTLAALLIETWNGGVHRALEPKAAMESAA